MGRGAYRSRGVLRRRFCSFRRWATLWAVRLDVLLARNAGWSRTVARAVIAERRVQIAGTVVEDPRREIAPAELPFSVVVDEQELPLHNRVTLALNKPLGCVTALRDPRHPTAYELLTEAPLFGELRPVGRLDLDTSGLLIWSTDGTEIQRLTHPKRAVPRTYQAALAGPFSPLPDKLVLDDGHEPKISALEACRATPRTRAWTFLLKRAPWRRSPSSAARITRSGGFRRAGQPRARPLSGQLRRRRAAPRPGAG